MKALPLAIKVAELEGQLAIAKANLATAINALQTHGFWLVRGDGYYFGRSEYPVGDPRRFSITYTTLVGALSAMEEGAIEWEK